ncbi:eukaryotic peptide chain release factor subunit 1-1-like [Punica granatum]|uniref:Eukaryotic peptide chain release factor subunit 1-1-like n=1 Tax=Punica granatum TaxID=22663 RepID=A0A6P8DYS1_PUNGR|nr:eukaryotic peptide chain release factor subunit 1-1-like [Punica granatum]
MFDAHENHWNIEIWKIKKLIKDLDAAQGNGTSIISLIIPPGDQISRVTKMLQDEYETATKSQSPANLLGAITSTQQRLELYGEVPHNGLVLNAGTVLTEDGIEKNVNIDFEPFKPINASLFLRDSKFHTKALFELLSSDHKFGFIIMDGNGTTLFRTLSGNSPKVLHKFSVEDPSRKRDREGQSALPFAGLGLEKCNNYFRKTAELATQFFIDPSTGQPEVTGLFLLGAAGFKVGLSDICMFDPRLGAKILDIYRTRSGEEYAFDVAIRLSLETINIVNTIPERKLLGKYSEEIRQDPRRCVSEVDKTLEALEMGAIEILIVLDFLAIDRYPDLKNTSTGEVLVKYLNRYEERDKDNLCDSATSGGLVVQEKMSLVDWLANEHERFGRVLRFVIDTIGPGFLFGEAVRGIAGLLRYQLEVTTIESDDSDALPINKASIEESLNLYFVVSSNLKKDYY